MYDNARDAAARIEIMRQARRQDARRRSIVVAALACAALLVVGVMGAVLWRSAQPEKRQPAVTAQAAGVAVKLPGIDAPLPAVEPLELKPLPASDARAINAAVPFSTLPNPAARKFIAGGSTADIVRATDCLAAAVLYEAGDDAVGERAVAQVVLNRVRHPAFPHTVCGVVFQGSERKTGCQFTFTCDGAMTRMPPPAAWARARAIAAQALAGNVFASVGLATHYHTDWVVPYWSSSLDKVTAVKTHLFFRWTGGWGRPPAFFAAYGGVEPLIPQLAAISEAHRDAALAGDAEAAAAAAAAIAAAVTSAAPPPSPSFAPTANNPDAFLVTLGADVAADSYPALAKQACGARPRCLFMAWPSAVLTPKALPASTSQLEAMTFHYLRDPGLKQDRMRWDCSRTRRTNLGECLSRQSGGAPAPAGPAAPVSGSATP
ncbi:cell wall hydrolase [Sphingomonas gei]|nr:cell wall hydrolase [Sphingomonas gei]